MSSPQPGGPPQRPLRLAGLALVAVAVIALAAGLISVFIDGGDGGDGIGAPPPGQTSSAAPSDGVVPTDGASPTAPTDATVSPPAGPGTSVQPQPPPATSAPGAQPPPPAAPPPTAQPVRVYNNSTIQGLAARAADDFGRAGWRVEEISNYSAGIIPTSTVYFRPGTDEEAAARVLGNRFDLRIEPRFPGIEGASPGLIVIVTNDYGAK